MASALIAERTQINLDLPSPKTTALRHSSTAAVLQLELDEE